jgi:benzaldehyde dehydrogenase (NAD)
VTGDPSDPETQIGPVVNKDAADYIRELIDDAREKGAKIVAGGDGDGTMLRPTVISGVTPEMRIYAEESFGPVVAVIEVDGDDEAIEVANDTEYGLAAAVFGGDVQRALGVAGKIESGICHVNGSTVHDEAAAPFGGVKHSGWGRFGAGQVAREFTDLRWITISAEDRHYPI